MSLAKNRAHTERYVEEQEVNFIKLIKDLENGNLSGDLTKNEILNLYGEPIYTKKDREGIELWFYRMPVDYFTSDKAYLYFDSKNRLIDWEYKKYTK